MQQNNLTSSYFPVSEVPAVGIPVEGKEIDGTGYKFIVREDTNDILSCVTNSYKLVTNKEIMQKASPEVSAMGGAFRLLCSNGLVIGYSIGKEGSRHTVWNKKDEIEAIVNSVINKTTTVFNEDFPKMVEKGVKKKDTQKILEMFPGYTMESIVQYLISTPPKNYWDLLNTATWATTHVMKRKAEATHKFETKIFDTIKSMAARA